MCVFREKKITTEATDWSMFLLFFKEHIMQKKSKLVFLLLLIFVGTLVTSLNPYLYGKIIDNITGTDLNDLIKYLLLYFCVTILARFLSAYELYLGQILNFELTRDSQSIMFDRIIRMRMEKYQTYDVGELISRINGDSGEVVSFEINFVTESVQILVDLFVALYYVIKISTRLSTVALFYIPASFILVQTLKKYFKLLAERQKKLGDQFYGFQTETFHNNIGIKSFCLEDHANHEFRRFVENEKALLKKRIFWANIKQIASSLITLISSMYVIYVSAVLIRADLLTIGSMVAFNSYSGRLFSAISQILSIKISSQEAGVSLKRINEIMNADIETTLEENSTQGLMPQIACRNVTFSYGDSAKTLDKMTVEFNKSGLYCIIGANGSGKSTLAKLLIKLYDADSGGIYLGDINYREITYKNIRSRITYVQSEDFFFHGSIMDNLRLGKADADEQEVNDLCKKVGVIDLIESLADGLNTVVGEGGYNLSSGEKQKLSIVRAMLRDTPIYILDEITANLDGKSEKELMEFLQEISSNKVIIVISHKSTTIRYCHEIYKFSDGKLLKVDNQ